jgi:hypothetical protein
MTLEQIAMVIEQIAMVTSILVIYIFMLKDARRSVGTAFLKWYFL